jgi:tetratricopeptide (TPR) repeat protein
MKDMKNVNTESDETFKNQGNNFFRSGHYKEALEMYEQASQINPTVPAYFCNAAACWEKLGNYEKMAEAARKSIKADGNVAKGYFRLATAQRNLNQLGECVKTLENGLGIDPSNVAMKHLKNEIIVFQREWGTAQVRQAEATKSEGNNFFKKGNYKEALEMYEQASRVNPTVPAYFCNAAACWEKLGNYEKMAKAAKNSIKADRNFVKGYLRLATAHKNLNQLVECITALENGLGVDPSNVAMKHLKNEIMELHR